jgi:hypothetical protein
MKKLLLIALVFALAACSTVKVSFDYDQTVDFSKYKTYAFTADSLTKSIGELNRGRVLQAFESEAALKGLTKSATPDLLVNIHIKGNEVVTATANTMGAGPWGYRYGGGFASTQITYDSYTEGTMFISFLDSKSGNLVWQGIGTKALVEKASAEEREKNINYAVHQIMMNYPPKAK